MLRIRSYSSVRYGTVELTFINFTIGNTANIVGIVSLSMCPEGIFTVIKQNVPFERKLRTTT